MDLTTIVVSSAVGGAAGSFIKELSSNGITWLCDLVTAQSPEMQAAAKKNMENFVIRLSHRIERLEHELPTGKAQIFQDALNHPSSALLIKTAIVDAAITDNNEKHELLAELIAQRLMADAEDMVALVGAAASRIVTCLTSKQIKLLAILTLIKHIKNRYKVNTPNHIKATVNIDLVWQNDLELLLNDEALNQISVLDYEHLAAMGCIRASIGSMHMINVIPGVFVETELQLSKLEFLDEKWFSFIKEQWRNLQSCTVTSVGRLIGVLYSNAKFNIKTSLEW